MNDLRLASETALELERLEKLPWFESGKPCRTDVFQERDFWKEQEAMWGRWGAQGIGQLRKVMLTLPSECEVRPVFAQEPAYYRMYQRRLPDLRIMLRQFDQFVAALKGEGVEVIILDPPSPEDAIGPYGFQRIFTTPSEVLVTNAGAIIPRMGCSGYLVGREKFWGQYLMSIGWPILFSIHGKGCGEIGAGAWLDDHHYLYAEGVTANQEGLRQLGWILQSIGVELHVGHSPGYVDLWDFPAGGVSHPDMMLGVVDLGLAIVYPAMLNWGTIRYLRELKFRLIEVPPEEFVHYGCNILTLAPGKIVIPAAAKQTIAALRREGVECLDLDLSQSSTGLGGPHCMTCQLLRDSGPSLDEL
jgi:N-dimethylarginine dimethylaminohydrolase